jgi:hypothetical protein
MKQVNLDDSLPSNSLQLEVPKAELRDHRHRNQSLVHDSYPKAYTGDT